MNLIALRRGIVLILVLAGVLAAQTAPPARYRIISADKRSKLLDAVNQAAADHYRVLFFTGAGALMEHTDAADPYKYILVEWSTARDFREQLNVNGSRGYRVADLRGHQVFPKWDVLMEKAPGRPNQFQYVLEDTHHIAAGKFGFPKDDFSRAPLAITGRIREGYSLAGQARALTVFEKAAEPVSGPAPCASTACYALRTLDTHKHFDSALDDAGRDGFRFTGSASWAGWSVTGVLVLFVRDETAKAYEYRTVPARHEQLLRSVDAVAQDGFCVQARVSDLVLLERDGARRCHYRVISGAADAVERDLEKAAAEGFRPVLLSPEQHAGFRKVTVTYTVFAEKEGP